MKTKFLFIIFISIVVITLLSIVRSSTHRINFAGKALYGNQSFSQTTLNRSVVFPPKTKKNIAEECDIPSKPERISGPSSICAGATYTFKIDSVDGATAYEWELPLGWAGISTTVSMTAIVGSAGGDILVRAINDCGNSDARHYTAMLSSSPLIPVITMDGNELISDAATGNQWYFESNPIKDATEKSFTPTDAGKYHVCITNRNSCTSCSIPTELSEFASVSTEEDIEENDGLVFPNPSSGIFTVKSKTCDYFVIYNANGEVILTKNMEEEEVVVDFTWKPKGPYWIEFHSETNIFKRKIIIY